MARKKNRRFRIKRAHAAIVLMFLVLPLGLVGFKFRHVGYEMKNFLPQETFRVALEMTMTGQGDSLRVSTFLPRPGPRLSVSDEVLDSDLVGFFDDVENDNRSVQWFGRQVEGKRFVRASFDVHGSLVEYDIDPRILVPGPKVSRALPELQSTPNIQIDHAEVAELAERLAPAGTSLRDGLQAIHDYCRDLDRVSFKGETDALTALRLQEASCNGKSRLFVALARRQGVAARLVGGLILTPGTKRTSHQWAEVLIGSHWVSFCPTNNHFASLPANFMALYRGDHALFTHTADTNFEYAFKIERELTIREDLLHKATDDPLNLMRTWNEFESAGVPIHLLRVVLLIPLGALVIVILRNVVGLQTFGVFLPTLIAVAARETGLVWGLAGFLVLVALSYFVRLGFTRLRLLHLPQMAIQLTFVVLLIFAIAAVGVHTGFDGLAHLSLFPVAILAITTERFALMMEEEGTFETIKVALMTAFTIAVCYGVVNAVPFQILFLSFPELLLVVVFLNIWLGRWMGLRVSEYLRFRRLILRGS